MRFWLRGVFLVLTVSAAFAASAAVQWLNVDKPHYLCGRQASNGYLTGKVVVVYRWGASIAESVDVLPTIQAIWESFKGPSFVLLGSHSRACGGKEQVQAIAREKGVTFPMYEDAGLDPGKISVHGMPYVYVVDPTGKVRYRGKNERTATDVVVSLMAKWQTPHEEADWRACLEFELFNLPAHAIERHAAFAKEFPEAAAAYDPQVSALKKLPGMQDMLKLLHISNRVGSYPIKDARERKILGERIASAVEKYAFLKQSKDPQLAQEAKNAIAELQWAAVER